MHPGQRRDCRPIPELTRVWIAGSRKKDQDSCQSADRKQIDRSGGRDNRVPHGIQTVRLLNLEVRNVPSVANCQGVVTMDRATPSGQRIELATGSDCPVGHESSTPGRAVSCWRVLARRPGLATMTAAVHSRWPRTQPSARFEERPPHAGGQPTMQESDGKSGSPDY